MVEFFSTLAEKVNPEHTALIVVDVQNDFCADGGAFAERGYDLSMIQSMVPTLDSFIGKARQAGVTIVYVRVTHEEIYNSPSWAERRAKGVNRICEAGTWGAELYVVSPQPGDVLVTKHRYSAFVGTDLDMVLRSKGIRTLLVSGVATNTCVECTARDGYQLDYYIVFLQDCSGSTKAHLHDATLENISRNFGVVCSSQDVVQAWGRPGS